jgi:hypothetical protein
MFLGKVHAGSTGPSTLLGRSAAASLDDMFASRAAAARPRRRRAQGARHEKGARPLPPSLPGRGAHGRQRRRHTISCLIALVHIPRHVEGAHPPHVRSLAHMRREIGINIG